jgi:hypothetical protein
MKDGYVFYNGPVAGISTHFLQYGYNCPPNYNPSDFIMFVSQTETVQDLRSNGILMETAPVDFSASTTDSENTFAIAEKLVLTKAGFWKQLYFLTERELVMTFRDTASLIGRFGITIFLNLLYGLIFYNSGGKDDSDPINFNTHFGAVTMIAISSMFGASQPVMLMFPFERPMFLREYSTGTCKNMQKFNLYI